MMKAPFKVPFWLSASVMVLVLGWMAWNWSPPVKWTFSGEVFLHGFPNESLDLEWRRSLIGEFAELRRVGAA